MLRKKPIKRKSKVPNPIKRKRKNPEIKVHSKNDTEYVRLSDFESEFLKNAKLILDKEDFEYWELDYEIDNILKYELNNSNAVNSGLLYLLSLKDFKKILTLGFRKRFDVKGLKYGEGTAVSNDMVSILEQTLKSIPKNITWIDTGN